MEKESDVKMNCVKLWEGVKRGVIKVLIRLGRNGKSSKIFVLKAIRAAGMFENIVRTNPNSPSLQL